jgi:hypothetical protein
MSPDRRSPTREPPGDPADDPLGFPDPKESWWSPEVTDAAASTPEALDAELLNEIEAALRETRRVGPSDFLSEKASSGPLPRSERPRPSINETRPLLADRTAVPVPSAVSSTVAAAGPGRRRSLLRAAGLIAIGVLLGLAVVFFTRKTAAPLSNDAPSATGPRSADPATRPDSTALNETATRTAAPDPAAAAPAPVSSPPLTGLPAASPSPVKPPSEIAARTPSRGANPVAPPATSAPPTVAAVPGRAEPTTARAPSPPSTTPAPPAAEVRPRPDEPAVVPPAGAPAVPPAATPKLDPELAARQAIDQVLDVYKQSYDRLDASTAATIWRGLDTAELARAFRTLISQDLTFDQCDVSVAGVRATAHCRGMLRYVPRVGGPSARIRRLTWAIELSRTNERWMIERVIATEVR